MANTRCDLCVSREATVYCKNDDAALCHDCDYSLHQANPLSFRHERVDLRTSSPVAHVVPVPPRGPGPTPATALPTLEDDDLEPLDWFVAQAKEQGLIDSAALPAPAPAAILAAPTPAPAPAPAPAPVAVPAPQPKPAAPKAVGDKDFLLGDDDFFFQQYFGDVLEGADSGLLSSQPALQDGVVPTMDFSKAAAPAPIPAATTYSAASTPSGIPAGASAWSAASAASVTPGKEIRLVPQEIPQGPRVPRQPPQSASWQLESEEGASSDDARESEEPLYVPHQRPPRAIRQKDGKRKRRPVEKVIRYPSRKAYADIRPRIKGRFATQAEVDALKAQGAL